MFIYISNTIPIFIAIVVFISIPIVIFNFLSKNVLSRRLHQIAA